MKASVVLFLFLSFASAPAADRMPPSTTVVSTAPFVRGEVNDDGVVDLADCIVLLQAFFGGSRLPSCADAADVDDNGVLTVADVVYLFFYLYQGGNPPPDPFPWCGTDPTRDSLACGVSAGCP